MRGGNGRRQKSGTSGDGKKSHRGETLNSGREDSKAGCKQSEGRGTGTDKKKKLVKKYRQEVADHRRFILSISPPAPSVV